MKLYPISVHLMDGTTRLHEAAIDVAATFAELIVKELISKEIGDDPSNVITIYSIGAIDSISHSSDRPFDLKERLAEAKRRLGLS